MGKSDIILVVDDNDVIRQTTRAMLEVADYQVFEAKNGIEGLALAKELTPQLILLDVDMPEMNGWQFMEKLRLMPEFVLVPVIFFTGLDNVELRAQAFRLGADDFVAKPFHPEELIFRVNKAIKNAQRLKYDIISAFRGKLAEIGLASLLLLAEMEKKTGVLIVRSNQNAPGEVAEIHFRRGIVIRTQFAGAQPLTNEYVIYYLFTWKEGEYDFISRTVVGRDEIGIPINELLNHQFQDEEDDVEENE